MDGQRQLSLLELDGELTAFRDRLAESGLDPLTARAVEILQLNITRRCNLSCKHCHVKAGAARTEEMSREVLERCLAVAADPSITTIDVTGGAPETNPHLPWFIEQAASMNKRLIVRSNLVILLEEGYTHFPDLYAQHRVELIGSLPDYQPQRVNRQRGEGVFERCIEAIQLLNERGYGLEGSGRILGLMHTPAGAYLPADQQALEREYRSHLESGYGVRFSTFYSLTNCPIGRYLEYLVHSDNLDDYMQELADAFNPAAAANAMCRTTLSVGPDGTLYDCDFNQMLGQAVEEGTPANIRDFDREKVSCRQIRVRNHCYSCTAGAGSSCQGATGG
jgi:radical SAM/Cys-rich protein